jgi:hypothetical protein
MQAVRQRRTSRDNSRGMAAPNRASALPAGLRLGLAAAGLAGVAALVAATAATVIRITVGTTTRLANLDTELSGWERHGPALLVIGAFALVMLLGALRGARPAMLAVAACGLAALVVALGLDLPHLDDTGQVGRLYTDASAGPEAGFWLEVCGGALLVVCGGGLFVLARRSAHSHPVPARPYQRPLGAGVSDETGESRGASSRG